MSGGETPVERLARLCAGRDPLDRLLGWAAAVAARVARHYRLRPDSQEDAELTAVAHLCLCELAAAFDPAAGLASGDVFGAFCGWAYIEVSSRCRREARRLRNGGTYHTRRERTGQALVVPPFSDLDDGEPFDPAAREPADDDRNPYPAEETPGATDLG